MGIGATASSFYAGQGITCLNGYRNTKMDNIASDIKAAKPSIEYPLELQNDSLIAFLILFFAINSSLPPV